MAFDIGDATAAAALHARDVLARAALRPDERGMARVATQAVFCEALLGALRARIAELRTVAR